MYEPHTQNVKATGSGSSGSPFTFTVDAPELWHPDSPTLYNITIKLGEDTIQSYTGFRTVSRGVINGIQRPLLSKLHPCSQQLGDSSGSILTFCADNKFIFPFGPLDQGFWPDGKPWQPLRVLSPY